MAKLTTKEDVALLVEEASEMFEETACVPDIDGKKVPAERIVPHAKQYILETIDNPKSIYDTELWHSPGYTLVLSWLSQRWLKKCQKLAPTVVKDVDRHLPKDQQIMCLDWATDDLIRDIDFDPQKDLLATGVELTFSAAVIPPSQTTTRCANRSGRRPRP